MKKKNYLQKTCQAIERGFDLESKISEYLEKNHIEASTRRVQVIKGLILELLGDKKFSEENLDKAFELGWYIEREDCKEKYLAYKQSLQKSGWEVEFVMEAKEPAGENVWMEPKRDEKGRVILKRKS